MVIAVGDASRPSRPPTTTGAKSTKRNMPAGVRGLRARRAADGGSSSSSAATTRTLKTRASGGGELVPLACSTLAARAPARSGPASPPSGIYAPTRFDRPRPSPPPTPRTASRPAISSARPTSTRCGPSPADVLLLHEWPCGIAGRERAVARPARAASASATGPRWQPSTPPPCDAAAPALGALHLYRPHAATSAGTTARVTACCLDQVFAFPTARSSDALGGQRRAGRRGATRRGPLAPGDAFLGRAPDRAAHSHRAPRHPRRHDER